MRELPTPRSRQDESHVDDELVGWRTYEFDAETGTIDYVGESNDGGGNQEDT